MLLPDAFDEIHRHPLARRVVEFGIEDVRFDELGVLVAEGNGLTDAEDRRQAVI